jgi:hypothetical protein
LGKLVCQKGFKRKRSEAILSYCNSPFWDHKIISSFPQKQKLLFGVVSVFLYGDDKPYSSSYSDNTISDNTIKTLWKRNIREKID